MSKKVVIGYHGHCFDGMCSAAAVTHFLREYEAQELDLSYRSLEHQAGGSFVPVEILTGDINAVVDFRYTTSDKLTWWFDHHVSGIVDGEERAHLDRDKSGRKFFDPTYSSCCKLIVDTARDRFGLGMANVANLVHWADIIDSARFDDAKTAVELAQPALQLMTVIEAHGGDGFLEPCITKLAEGLPLDDLARDPKVQKLFQPLLQAHQKTCQMIREKSEFSRGVVTFDLVGSGTDRYNKFIPYWYYPEARYCVAVLTSRLRAKISVGSNPWSPVPRRHDIARICARYGGGGHPTVGAVSFKPEDVERAREIGKVIAEELRG